MMVYCHKIEESAQNVVYEIGTSPDSMTGYLRFFRDGTSPELTQPEDEQIASMWIRKMLAKYHDSLTNGIFPDKMAYEC